MNTPDSMLWWCYPCRQCGQAVAQVRGFDLLPPNDPRNPKSLCFVCQDLERRSAPERDRVARALIESVQA